MGALWTLLSPLQQVSFVSFLDQLLLSRLTVCSFISHFSCALPPQNAIIDTNMASHHPFSGPRGGYPFTPSDTSSLLYFHGASLRPSVLSKSQCEPKPYARLSRAVYYNNAEGMDRWHDRGCQARFRCEGCGER